MKENIVFHTSLKIRLDGFLRQELPLKIKDKESISNGKIRRLIVAGSVSVNGHTVTRPAFELRGRSLVTVDFDKDKFFYEKQPDDISFSLTDKDVLYEDDNLIFINKPAFFPVEQTITGNRNNLHDAVVKYLWERNPELRNPPYAGIMHRLDRETSGVIMFTKNRTVNKVVSSMFQEHNFKKIYTAVVSPVGKINIPSISKITIGCEFTIEKYMGRISPKSQAGKWGTLPESKGGLYSKTSFKILSQCEIGGHTCFYVSCNLETGRTHQIRVHLSEAGLPIVGDVLYGGIPGRRMMLHASSLEIHNPEINIDSVIEAPLPFS